MRFGGVLGLAALVVLGACAQDPSEQRVASRGSEPGEISEPAPEEEPTTSTSGPAPTSTTSAPELTTATTATKPGSGDPCARPTLAEFALGGGAKPRELAVAPDGTVWFTDNGGRAVGRLTPDGTVKMFPLTQHRQPAGIALGPGGDVWFTQYAWSDVGRTPDQPAPPPDPATIGPPAIGRITPDGTMSEFPLPTLTGNRLGAPDMGALPRGIVAGPDGAMWFTEAGADQIGRIADGTITEYPLPSQDEMHAFPDRILLGPDGAIWFTETLRGSLGRVDLRTATIEEHLIEPRTPAGGAFTQGPDGAFWFGGLDPVLGRMTTAGRSSSFSLSPDVQVIDALITGPDGRLWVADTRSGAIVRVTTKGAASRLMAVPGVTAGNWEALGGMAAADDGAVWLATPATSRIIRISCGS